MKEITESNRLIAEFELLGYKITDDLRVIGKNGIELKLHPNRNGYIQVNCWKNSKQKTFLMHRLVASKFIPNPLGLSEVNHINGIKSDYRVENLEWVSRSQNIQHGFGTGLIAVHMSGKTGSAHHRSKSVDMCDMGGTVIKTYGSAREAARLSGINYGTISNVLIGKGKSAGGFKWKYTNS